MKVLRGGHCDCAPLDDERVLSVLDRPGFHRVAWKCPKCRHRWIASGSRWSKMATPNVLWFFGWREVD